MSKFDDLVSRAIANPKHIVLAEGTDPRIVEAAVKASWDGVATISLLGPEKEIRALTRAAGDDEDAINIIDLARSSKSSAYADEYFRLRQHKNIERSAADAALNDPLNYANMMVRLGDADGSVAGAVYSTSDVIRSTLHIIGVKPESNLVSSFFLMMFDADIHQRTDGIIFTDCGLVIDPNTDELAEIASTAAESGRHLLGLDPKVAMLSFSTHGSAKHSFVDKMIEATRKLKTLHPQLPVDGELQFDTAFDPQIASRKAEGSDVAGQANVFVFPDINAGNIGYKIAERVGKMSAIGPILQGVNKPANDLSRGSDSEAIYGMIVVTVLQAGR